MQRILLFSLLLLTAACQSGTEKEDGQSEAPAVDLEEVLPGTWESVSLRVEVNSAQGQDTSYVFEVKEEEWVRRLGMKPVKTYYLPEKKYRQEFTNRSDSLVNTSRGIWNVFGDTLMMIAPDATYQYTVKVENGLAEYRTLMDWDGDGAVDDAYLGRQRQISRGVED
jgi:hypothetical protein